jgi:hypothetical protein
VLDVKVIQGTSYRARGHKQEDKPVASSEMKVTFLVSTAVRMDGHGNIEVGEFTWERVAPIVRESFEESEESDRCGICGSVDHFREDHPQHRAEHLGSDGLGYGKCLACGELWPCQASRT